MASDYDATEFVDTDFQARQSPQASANALVGALQRAPTRAEVDSKVAEAQQKLAELKRAQEDLERESILIRCGLTFERIRGSLFFRDEDRAMEPVFRRLEALGIAPELNSPPTSTMPKQDEIVERVIRRAQEFRNLWNSEQQEDAN